MTQLTTCIFSAVIFACIAFPAFARDQSPDCSGENDWPAGMAFTHMKNAGFIDNETVEFPPKVTLINTQKIGIDKVYYNEPLYRQVHSIIFIKKSGVKLGSM
jgi:hypothetical protein